MTQQLHYTIDTFELNYEATPLTGVHEYAPWASIGRK